jgi:hypothetical protein
MAQSTDAPPRPAPGSVSPTGDRRAAITAGEFAVGAIVLLVGVLSWVSLDLAHLGHYRLWLAASITGVMAAAVVLIAGRVPRPEVAPS